MCGHTEKRQHEDSIIANSKLIGIAEIVSRRELVILAEKEYKYTSINIYTHTHKGSVTASTHELQTQA